MLFDIDSPRSRTGTKYDIKMKKLSDLCLLCIGNNLHSVIRPGRFLPLENKEVLLERLINHDALTEQKLPFITYNLFSYRLQRINFYKSRQITDSLLKQLNECGCQLEWLTIHACPNITDAGICNITENQVQLQCVEFRKLTTLTKKGLTKLISYRLRKVDLRGCTNVESEAVALLTKNNPQIKHLILVRCVKLNNNVLPIIATNLKQNLEILDIADMRCLTDTGIQHIAENSPQLKKLNIGGCNLVSDTGMGHLFARCQQLRSLNMSYCAHHLANNQVLMHIPESIVELSLCGVMMSNSELFVNSLARLTSLRSVWLCGMPVLCNNTLEKVLEKIGSQLEELDLSGGLSQAVTDKGLKSVTKYCTSLKVLGVSMLKEIHGDSLLPLFRNSQRANQITGLLMSCKKLNFELLQAVSMNCHNLVKLDLGGNNTVDDIMLLNVAEYCHQLNYLNIKGCLEISDEGVCAVAMHCPIGVLVLSGLRKITDKSIITVANNCPYLEEIYMNGCYNVSRAAIQYLVDQCFKRLYWTHKIPNANPDSLVAKNLDTGEFGRFDEMGQM